MVLRTHLSSGPADAIWLPGNDACKWHFLKQVWSATRRPSGSQCRDGSWSVILTESGLTGQTRCLNAAALREHPAQSFKAGLQGLADVKAPFMA